MSKSIANRWGWSVFLPAMCSALLGCTSSLPTTQDQNPSQSTQVWFEGSSATFDSTDAAIAFGIAVLQEPPNNITSPTNQQVKKEVFSRFGLILTDAELSSNNAQVLSSSDFDEDEDADSTDAAIAFAVAILREPPKNINCPTEAMIKAEVKFLYDLKPNNIVDFPCQDDEFFVVNVVTDASDADLADGICETASFGECSLRAAMEQANATGAGTTISFNIPGSTPQIISVLTPLPILTTSVTVDGLSQPGSDCSTDSLGIVIDGSSAGSKTSGISGSADNLMIQGLQIQNFSQDGIALQGNGHTVRCSISTNNAKRGISLQNGETVTIQDNRVTSALGEGIFVSDITGNITITDNRVSDTRQETTDTNLEAGIFVRNNAGSINAIIAGNLIETTTPFTDYRVDGVEVNLCRPFSGYTTCSSTASGTYLIQENTVIHNGIVVGGADGIDINGDTGAIFDSITLHNNTITNMPDKSISFGLLGTAEVTTSNLHDNTITAAVDNGIHIRPRGSSIVQEMQIYRNTVTGVGANSISVSLNRDDPPNDGANSAKANVLIYENTLSEANRGIDLATDDTGLLEVSVSDNTISNTLGEGIRLRTNPDFNATSEMYATVKDNVLTSNINTSGSGNGSLAARSRRTSVFCGWFQGNQGGSTSTTDFELRQSDSSTFRVSDGVSTTPTLITLSTNNNGTSFTNGGGTLTFISPATFAAATPSGCTPATF